MGETLMKYRKKPVVIEAVEWTGENLDEIMAFVTGKNLDHDPIRGLVIHTLEGNHSATLGDMIIKGIKGEFYPCKPDIFKQTYQTYERVKLDVK